MSAEIKQILIGHILKLFYKKCQLISFCGFHGYKSLIMCGFSNLYLCKGIVTMLTPYLSLVFYTLITPVQ